VRLRFGIAYGLLALITAGRQLSRFVVVRIGPERPVAPGAVKVVQQFMTALKAGDTRTACRLSSDLPPVRSTPQSIERYRIFPAEYTVGGVAVPVTIDDAYAEIDLTRNARGTYRITTIPANPSSTRPSPESVA
jgi:hypothetical protein